MKWFYISTKASTVMMMMLVLISPSQYCSIIGSAFMSNDDTNERDNKRGAITTSTTTSRTITTATSRTSSTAASADRSSPGFEQITNNYNKHDNNYNVNNNIPWLFSFNNNAVSPNKDTPVPVPTNNTTTSGGVPSQSPSVAQHPSAPPSNDTNTTKAPTVSPKPSISSAPSSHKHDNTTSHVPTSSPSLHPTFANVTTHKPSISNAPTVIPGPGTNPPDTTSKPTKKYTTSPTLSPNHSSVAPTLPSHGGRKRHGFVYNLSKFIFWVFMSMVAFLAFGKIMSHRTQIYFVLCQIWYKLKYYLSRFFNRVQDVCSRLGAMGFLHKVGDLFARVGGWIMGWIGQVRGAFGGRGGRGGGTGGRGGGLVDDDGSTMMQGLLMRENV